MFLFSNFKNISLKIHIIVLNHKDHKLHEYCFKDYIKMGLIKEMQIKTTLRFHLIPLRIAIIKTSPTADVGKDVGKKEPSYTAGENAS
jgi:hypothetical protein